MYSISARDLIPPRLKNVSAYKKTLGEGWIPVSQITRNNAALWKADLGGPGVYHFYIRS